MIIYTRGVDKRIQQFKTMTIDMEVCLILKMVPSLHLEKTRMSTMALSTNKG